MHGHHEADYAEALRQYNPRKCVRFPFILLRMQLGNSLCPGLPVSTCWSRECE